MGEVEPEGDSELNLDELHRLLDEKWGGLMDVSHAGMQYARRVVQDVRNIQEEFDENCDELIGLLILKATAFARVAENLIMAEFDSAEVDAEIDEDEEEEDE